MEIPEIPTVKYCKTDWKDPYKDVSLWCFVHEKKATHCSPSGYENVCEEYAKSQGCSCCEENYPSNFTTIHIRKESLREFLTEMKLLHPLASRAVLLHFGNLEDLLKKEED